MSKVTKKWKLNTNHNKMPDDLLFEDIFIKLSIFPQNIKPKHAISYFIPK